MAEYLLAEVLDRQPAEVRRLLLRTSVLDRVNGELADLLTEGSGGERVLQELEEANAFVVSLDAARSWFRCHHLFAGLLRLELRRTEPDEVAALHELAAVAAADELAQGSLAAAERYLGLAERESASVPEGRRGQAQVLLGVVRLLLARQRGNLPAMTEEARRLQALAGAPETARYDLARAGLGEELRGLALISLGIAEVWATRFDRAEPHLEQGVALARRIGRPYLEFTGLAYQAVAEFYLSFPWTAERGMEAVELAREHGWTDDPAAGIAYMRLGSVLAWQGRTEEAEPWVQHAERTVRAEAEPAAALGVHHVRGVLELARGRDADALAGVHIVNPASHVRAARRDGLGPRRGRRPAGPGGAGRGRESSRSCVGRSP